ncbi:MAG: hypothetical protein FRX49_05115 [Trebouxia sp. A1-2]|nr:MAG: hypothetical protein FRX49_05115 [Trebouxia sp. A1-2]
MIGEPEASSNLPHGFPCEWGFPGAACRGAAGGESKLRRGQLTFGGHNWQLHMRRDPMKLKQNDFIEDESDGQHRDMQGAWGGSSQSIWAMPSSAWVLWGVSPGGRGGPDRSRLTRGPTGEVGLTGS